MAKLMSEYEEGHYRDPDIANPHQNDHNPHEPMTDEQIDNWKLLINQMSREEMCRLWRFAPAGHPCFSTGTPVTRHFRMRFDSLGGFSPEISKKIGWDKEK